nr:transcription factor bHLH114 [Tanacetum cinerariifolium]
DIIESQRSENVKEGVGYNAVPPPTANPYCSPKKDFSWTGLLEFADDTVTDYTERPKTDKVETIKKPAVEGLMMGICAVEEEESTSRKSTTQQIFSRAVEQKNFMQEYLPLANGKSRPIRADKQGEPEVEGLMMGICVVEEKESTSQKSTTQQIFSRAVEQKIFMQEYLPLANGKSRPIRADKQGEPEKSQVMENPKKCMNNVRDQKAMNKKHAHRNKTQGIEGVIK